MHKHHWNEWILLKSIPAFLPIPSSFQGLHTEQLPHQVVPHRSALFPTQDKWLPKSAGGSHLYLPLVPSPFWQYSEWQCTSCKYSDYQTSEETACYTKTGWSARLLRCLDSKHTSDAGVTMNSNTWGENNFVPWVGGGRELGRGLSFGERRPGCSLESVGVRSLLKKREGLITSATHGTPTAA